MKKIIISIIYAISSIVSIQAQTLYGTTFHGGITGNGTINKFLPATNNLQVVKLLSSAASNPAYTSLIEANDGKLYGMTLKGGSKNVGVIFSFDATSNTYTKLIDFDSTKGASPYGSLVQASNGKLYGMTSAGGNNNLGVIFSFDSASSTFTKLKDFNDTDGENPFGSLIQATDGKLYGMTYGGGNLGLGVIFSFDPIFLTYTRLHNFKSDDGEFPVGSLVQATDGRLYGMTSRGGDDYVGVIFSLDPVSSVYNKLVNFNQTNGSTPLGSLIEADGKLYGQTAYGGGGVGVIFSFDPVASVFVTIKKFSGVEGSYPSGDLVRASDKKLYGTTSGTLFSFDPSSLVFTNRKNFDGTNGSESQGGLVQAKDGKLYGLTTSGGIDNLGVIYSFNPSSSEYVKLKSFGTTNETGSHISASLVQAADKKLYGMTNDGGAKDAGVIFPLIHLQPRIKI